MFSSWLAAALLSGSAFAAQQPFTGVHQPPQDIEFVDNAGSSAPFVFSSLSGLLRQWPNTYHPNGHTIVSGTLEPFTLLYHARRDPDIPLAEEWFAFDPEMSYGIMGGRGLTYMLTYQTLRPAKVVYFDGMSAALSDSGWLDSQEVLLSGKSKGDNSPWEGGGVFGEDRRLTELCKWFGRFGVEGIVRMNAGLCVVPIFVSDTLSLMSPQRTHVVRLPVAVHPAYQPPERHCSRNALLEQLRLPPLARPSPRPTSRERLRTPSPASAQRGSAPPRPWRRPARRALLRPPLSLRRDLLPRMAPRRNRA